MVNAPIAPVRATKEPEVMPQPLDYDSQPPRDNRWSILKLLLWLAVTYVLVRLIAGFIFMP
jgi:hypothetical protein